MDTLGKQAGHRQREFTAKVCGDRLNQAADETILGWHFTHTNKLLRYGDNRLVQAGKTLKARWPMGYDAPTLRHAGMHASVDLLGALEYAPGPYLWRVELSGRTVHGNDKCCADSRKALWGFDATNVLRDFARQCALDVIKNWDAPEVVRNYLTTGDESLRAAARSAARAAARASARASASDAAWAAAWAAASDAAWAAASAAASTAASTAQNTRLHAMVMAEAKSRGFTP